MVIVDGLSVKFHDQMILRSVSCNLLQGRITIFIGKSGAGKTTILKVLAGLMRMFEGLIIVNEQKILNLSPKQRSEEIGYVFQDFNLFPHLSVLNNCVDPLLVHGIPYHQAEQKAFLVLQQLEMENFIHAYPAQLSGGQKQRVAIARTLCLQPKVFLLDEPTASLDPLNTDILVHILKTLAAQGLTIGVSSQDMNFVRKIFDRVYYVHNGEIMEFCEGIENMSSCSFISAFI